MKKYFSSRKVSNLSLKDRQFIYDCLIQYCYDNLGHNGRHKNFPTVCERTSGDHLGHYNPHNNCIHIYLNNNKTLGELTSSYIHEYTHYLQPIKTKYFKLLKIHGYQEHPFEIEAIKNENLHNQNFLNYLKKQTPND